MDTINKSEAVKVTQDHIETIVVGSNGGRSSIVYIWVTLRALRYITSNYTLAWTGFTFLMMPSRAPIGNYYCIQAVYIWRDITYLQRSRTVNQI